MKIENISLTFRVKRCKGWGSRGRKGGRMWVVSPGVALEVIPLLLEEEGGGNMRNVIGAGRKRKAR
jgi:hypothetical protein